MKITKVSLASRTNPTYNPKISTYDYLLKWSKDPNIFISLTDVDKIGINPHSHYNTPIGIYCYPLKEAWLEYRVEEAGNLRVLPYAALAPHIWVLQINKNNPNRFINDLYRDYGSNKFDKDSRILKDIFTKHRIDNTEDENKIAMDWAELYTEALKTARIKNPCSSFWNLSRLVAINISFYSDEIEVDLPENDMIRRSIPIKWNWLLRKCGYSGFADRTGHGVIHPSEPMQAVFLTKDALTVIGSCENKMYAGKDRRVVVDSMLSFIKALGQAENMFDYDEPYSIGLLSWLLDLPSELSMRKMSGKISVKKSPIEIWETCNGSMYQILLDYCKRHRTEDPKWYNRAVHYITKKYNTLGIQKVEHNDK